MPKPAGFSLVQIGLHWAVAILILAQFLDSDDMNRAWRAVEEGGAATYTTLVWTHVLVGIAVLVFAVWRMVLKFSRGVPEAPEGTSGPMELAGEAGHWALYALMLALPITGLLGWYGGIIVAIEWHQLAKVLLIVVVSLHVLAALYHQYIRKDHLLLRMMRPKD
jgi:cytochrome b561